MAQVTPLAEGEGVAVGVGEPGCHREGGRAAGDGVQEDGAGAAAHMPVAVGVVDGLHGALAGGGGAAPTGAAPTGAPEPLPDSSPPWSSSLSLPLLLPWPVPLLSPPGILLGAAVVVPGRCSLPAVRCSSSWEVAPSPGRGVSGTANPSSPLPAPFPAGSAGTAGLTEAATGAEVCRGCDAGRTATIMIATPQATAKAAAPYSARNGARRGRGARRRGGVSRSAPRVRRPPPEESAKSSRSDGFGIVYEPGRSRGASDAPGRPGRFIGTGSRSDGGGPAGSSSSTGRMGSVPGVSGMRGLPPAPPAGGTRIRDRRPRIRDRGPGAGSVPAREGVGWGGRAHRPVTAMGAD